MSCRPFEQPQRSLSRKRQKESGGRGGCSQISHSPPLPETRQGSCPAPAPTLLCPPRASCRPCHQCSCLGPTRKGPGLGVWCSAATVPKFIIIVPLRCPVGEVQWDSGACTGHLEPRLHSLRFLSPARLLAACPPGPPGPQDALAQGVLRQSAAGGRGIHQACVFPQYLRALESSFSRLCVRRAGSRVGPPSNLLVITVRPPKVTNIPKHLPEHSQITLCAEEAWFFTRKCICYLLLLHNTSFPKLAA